MCAGHPHIGAHARSEQQQACGCTGAAAAVAAPPPLPPPLVGCAQPAFDHQRGCSPPQGSAVPRMAATQAMAEPKRAEVMRFALRSCIPALLVILRGQLFLPQSGLGLRSGAAGMPRRRASKRLHACAPYEPLTCHRDSSLSSSSSHAPVCRCRTARPGVRVGRERITGKNNAHLTYLANILDAHQACPDQAARRDNPLTRPRASAAVAAMRERQACRD